MKTATIKIYEPHQTKGFCVAIFYKGELLRDFVGLKTDLQVMVESAIFYLENRKFTRLKANGKIYNFKDFMKGTA